MPTALDNKPAENFSWLRDLWQWGYLCRCIVPGSERWALERSLMGLR